MTIKLYSAKWGELLVTRQFPNAPPGLLLPGALVQVAAAPDNRYYYLFQEFNIGNAVIMSCYFFSLEKDTVTILTDQPITLRWATHRSHRYSTRSFSMQIFHERNYNCFYLPHSSMEYQVEAGADFSFVDILVDTDYLQLLHITTDTLQNLMLKVSGKFAAKLAPRKQVAPIELLRWIDELAEWMSADNKSYETGEKIVHQLVKQAVSRLTNKLFKTAIMDKQEEINKIYKAAEIIQMSGRYYTNNNLKELAEQVSVSVYSLKGLFQMIYGYPILKHQSEEKMRLALRLVETKRLSEKVVADMLGFSSAQNFSKKYKIRFGHPPYRLVQNG